MTIHTEIEFQNGDWVIVARPGPRFGCSGIINRVVESDDTDLHRYRIGGDWFYHDELVAQPGGAPEWQLPAGPAHDIAALARKCGWAVHTTETDTHTGRVIAAISPAGADGMFRRLYAVFAADRWDCRVEVIDPRGITRREAWGAVRTRQDLEALIRAHSDTDKDTP